MLPSELCLPDGAAHKPGGAKSPSRVFVVSVNL